MIKVERLSKPEELTTEVQNKLIEEFKKNKKKSVWNKPYIRNKLLLECNNKCVYCESLIGAGHKEMHVDHFHYKDRYEDEVIDWNNLNPSCPHCNKSKSYHDTYEEPIINPFNDDPKDYFYLKNYRYYSKNDSVEKIASDTIDVLGLNDTQELVINRFTQGDAVIQKIKDIYELANENKNKLCTDTRKRNRVLNGCKNILKKGTKKEEYSAFIATIIKDDENYQKLKYMLIELELWNDELQNLDNEVEKIKMQTRPDEN